MNYRLNTPALYTLGVFLVLAFILFGFIVMRQNSEKKEADNRESAAAKEQVPEEKAGKIITAKHDYLDGKHIIAGTMDLPTPCHILRHEVVFLNEDKSEVEVRFTSSVEDPEKVCAQVIYPTPFKVEFEGPEKVAISATLNGEPIVLNLVEVPEGEDIESFSEFIKG